MTEEEVQKGIDACHPMTVETPEALEADEVAMRLIHGRHEKREIVNLLRWLLMAAPTHVEMPLVEGVLNGGGSL